MRPPEEVAAHVEYTAGRLIERLDGLTDDEYLWTPTGVASGTVWSVRGQADGRWKPDLGPDGTPATDQDPPPITTIAWRMWHLGASETPSWPPTNATSGSDFVERWFTKQHAIESTAVGTAGEATRLLEANWAPLPGLIKKFTEDELNETMGDIAGPFAEGSLLGLLLHVADELIHHGAEISLLRDLYRATGKQR